MLPRTHAPLVAASLGAILLLGACNGPQQETATTPPPSPTSAEAPEHTQQPLPMESPETVATGLEAPWSVAFLDGTALISERDSGRILELVADGVTREIGTVAGVLHGGEGGLLGMASHGSDQLYVYSTSANGNRIQRFQVTGGPGALVLGEPEIILDQIPSGSNHNGGRIAFGPDGMLYATAGDAGSPDRAQDLGDLGGKILRMTPSGEVPTDNPFPDSLVYTYGHRNPQGLAWASDGTMFATEFGQNTWDELNIITPGGNYGWPTVEGIAKTAGFIDPVQQWDPGVASPSGMAHVNGVLFIANLRGGVLRAVPVADPTTSTEYFGGEYGRLRDVVESPGGALWFLTNNTDGRGNPGPEDDRILSVTH